jgi:glycine reductase complex component B subunit gamma
VIVTPIPALAQSVGANRIVAGKAVPHPFGDPDLATDEERVYRRRLVERALKALRTPVDHPSVL